MKLTQHWRRQGLEDGTSSYAPMGILKEYEEMVAQAGNKIEFAGAIYLNEPHGSACLLGIIADHQPSSRPVLVLTDDNTLSIPRNTHVVVRGCLAHAPYASPG